MSNIVSLFLILICASYCDIQTQKIPNNINLIAVVFVLTYHFFQNGWSAVFTSLGRGACVLFLLFPLFALKGLGAGDVKLLSIIAMFLSVKKALTIFLIGIFLSLIPIGIAKQKARNLKNTKISLVPMFALATVWVWLKEVF